MLLHVRRHVNATVACFRNSGSALRVIPLFLLEIRSVTLANLKHVQQLSQSTQRYYLLHERVPILICRFSHDQTTQKHERWLKLFIRGRVLLMVKCKKNPVVRPQRKNSSWISFEPQKIDGNSGEYMKKPGLWSRIFRSPTPAVELRPL